MACAIAVGRWNLCALIQLRHWNIPMGRWNLCPVGGPLGFQALSAWVQTGKDTWQRTLERRRLPNDNHDPPQKPQVAIDKDWESAAKGRCSNIEER